MIALSLTETSSAPPSMVQRLRIVVAACAIATGLHFAGVFTGLTAGWEPPVLLISGGAGKIGGALLVGVILLAGVMVARLLTGRTDLSSLLGVIGLSIALWVAPFGTMDEWLKRSHPIAGPGTSGPYLALLPDYFFLAALLLAVIAFFAPGATFAARFRSAFGMDLPKGERTQGFMAMACTVAVAVLGMVLLNGPRMAHTLRGQVYFSVAISLVLGVYAANYLTGVRNFAFYWPAPILVGIIGALVAAARPELPAPYANINIIPAWGGARALPVEMVGLGLIGVHWMVRALHRGS